MNREEREDLDFLIKEVAELIKEVSELTHLRANYIKKRPILKFKKAIGWKEIDRFIVGRWAPRSKYGPRETQEGLLLFKCVLLGRWYGLEDCELLEAIPSTLDYRLFLDIDEKDPVPDCEVLEAFRGQMAYAGLMGRLIKKAEDRLAQAGLDPGKLT